MYVVFAVTNNIRRFPFIAESVYSFSRSYDALQVLQVEKEPHLGVLKIVIMKGYDDLSSQ